MVLRVFSELLTPTGVLQRLIVLDQQSGPVTTPDIQSIPLAFFQVDQGCRSLTHSARYSFLNPGTRNDRPALRDLDCCVVSAYIKTENPSRHCYKVTVGCEKCDRLI